MADKLKIVGICGSLRKGSYNKKLLRLILTELENRGAEVEELFFEDFPLYSKDIEEKGIPSQVEKFKDKIAGADGLVYAIPEYNWSIPGAFKNALDWASRPGADIPRVFGGKVVMQAGTSDGVRATVRVQQHMLNVLQTFKMIVLPSQILIANNTEAFDENGNLINEGDRKQVESTCDKFIELLRKMRA